VHLDRGETGIRDPVEQPLTAAEQHRSDVEDDLVERPRRNAWRAVDAPPAMSTSRSPAARFARSRAAAKPSVTK
jgi:hypothetical protein